MTIATQKVQELVALLRQRYPNWTGFQDADFVKDEITYKRDTIAKAQKELSADELKRLLKAGQFDEFISRLDAIGKDNNLLYRAVPMSGDLGILYHPQLDKAAFCRAFFDLVHGPDAGHLRLTRYTDFVKAAGLPNKWTFPTYFLFICHPESEMFIKPRTTRWFLDFAAGWKSFAATPTPPSYVTAKQLAEQLFSVLREFGPRDMVDIQSFIWVCASLAQQGEGEDGDAVATEGQHGEFAKLFAEFLASYPASPEGQRHIQGYPKCRQQGEANFQAAAAAAGRGEDVTDLVLLKLLPYENTPPNRARGVWIHLAPSVIKDIKNWFEGAGWSKPEDWPKIAQAILGFIQRCVADPAQLPAACAEFAALPFVKGFQTGMLTPILNALRPDDFLLVNTKSRRVINYFGGTEFSLGLRDYPRTNAAGKELLAALAAEMKPAEGLNMRPCDLLDMFSHWLVAVKGMPSEIGFWKIAPGDDAWQW